MIILITGATHTGKTFIAQKLLEKHKISYLSIDHLKMGLIRSGNTILKPDSTYENLTQYLWPILKEIIKTNIENQQHLIIEGCYIPYEYKKDFNDIQNHHIHMISIVFSQSYIEKSYENIIDHSNVLEKRLDHHINQKQLIDENMRHLRKSKLNQINYIYIEERYDIHQIIEEISKFIPFQFSEKGI